MESTSAIIAARSKQQALDWSLVLLSQGIENTIDRGMEDGRWRLLVDGNDSQRAIQALRQYRTENRAPVWVRALPWTDLVFDWRSLAWFLLLTVIFFLGQT